MEALLLTHPAVQDVAVIGLPDEDAGELPLAFIVKKAGREISEKEIQKFVEGNYIFYIFFLHLQVLFQLTENVSSQKRLRGGVRFIPKIPRNPTGKILRRVLRERAKGIVKSKL